MVNFKVTPLIASSVELVLKDEGVTAAVKKKYERFQSKPDGDVTADSSSVSIAENSPEEISLAELNLLAEQLRMIDKRLNSDNKPRKKGNKPNPNAPKALFFRDLIVGSEATTEKPLTTAAPDEEMSLEDRKELLKRQQQDREYQALVQNVRKKKAEVNAGTEMKMMNEQMSIVINTIVTAIATFTAGYWICCNAYAGDTLSGILGGLFCAIFCVAAEVWLMVIRNSKKKRKSKRKQQ